MLLHADDMAHPYQLCLQHHGINTRGVSTVQDLSVADAVLQADSKYGVNGKHVKLLQLFVLVRAQTAPILDQPPTIPRVSFAVQIHIIFQTALTILAQRKTNNNYRHELFHQLRTNTNG